jgi:hypothetical protein
LQWTTWVVDAPSPNDPPPIKIQFPEPMDSYSGIVKRLSGRLAGDDRLRLRNFRGWFAAEIRNVSMGEPDLDESIYGSVNLLNGKQFPSATYTLESVVGGADRLFAGQVSDVLLKGTLELKGVVSPLDVPATLEPLPSAEGPPKIRLLAKFSLDRLRETFGIEGPGGPYEPAGNRVLLTVHAVLVPVNSPAR